MNQTLHPTHPVLVVDDDEGSLLLTNAALQMVGLNNILTCQDGQQVPALLAQHHAGLVFLDLMMPQIGGEVLLQTITQDYPGTLVVIVSAIEEMETAVRCIKQGAFDYVTKPVDFGRLSTVVKNALAFQTLQQENFALRHRFFAPGLSRPEAFAHIITQNNEMLLLFQHAEAIAATAEPVLITGETGVGKDLLARAIHTLSGRKGSLVAVNVAGLDDNVFSDTLFGHVRGAFTGAERARPGLIERAAGGTLFLDEIGDLTAVSQAKLLRLLQEGDYFPLGQDTPKHSDARVVSATNRNLWDSVKQGQFRKDLNFRLRTHHLHIPPLRERTDDLPLLIEHFLAEAAAQLNKDKLSIPDKLLPLLESYAFPGNIRELRTMIFDTASRSTSTVLSQALFKRYIAHRQADKSPQQGLFDETIPIAPGAKLPTLRQATELLIKEALRQAKGNQSVAAKLLGISQQAVSKRLKNMEQI